MSPFDGNRFRRLLGTVILALACAGLFVINATVPELVTVADPGNPPEPNSGLGSVSYVYRIGRTEITAAEYVEFLNAVAQDDPRGLYHPGMEGACGIVRTGAAGAYIYGVGPESRGLPIRYVSRSDARRFANWLHNGGRHRGDTERGAYEMSASEVVRSVVARFGLASRDEWLKAGYYHPTAAGGPPSGWWRFPTQSDLPPVPEPPPGGANSAAWRLSAPRVTGSYPSSTSHYGTMDQAGNVWEWEESRILGGCFADGINSPLAFPGQYPGGDSFPDRDDANVGFRVVALGPAPDSPPEIVRQPIAPAVVPGLSIALEVDALGTPPLTYQWYKDGELLISETNAVLRLDDLSASNLGGYKVVVTNPHGATTSDPALLRFSDFRQGLLLHLRLDGDAVDHSGRNPEAKVLGAMPARDRFGVNRGAFEFDGIDDVIVAPVSQLPAGNSERTMVVWFRGDDSREAPGGLVHFGNGNVGTQSGLGFHGANAYFMGGTQDFNAGPLTIGDWHFLAASYRTNGSLVVCVDGVLKSNELGQLRTVGTSNAWIGAVTIDEGAHFARYFRGAIDDVRIFGRALSPEELQLLYTLDQGAPAIVTPDSPQVAAVGSDFELIVTPRGVAPLQLQWYKDGVSLPGATNAVLRLIEVEVADAGSYKLMASNFVGGAWSSVIPLEVPPPLNPSRVLDAGPLGFVFPDKDSWQSDSVEVRLGTGSLNTGVVGDGETASIETDLRGPGELAFWWRISSEPGFDRFEVWMGQERLQALSGEQDWREVVVPIPADVHRIRWVFRRDSTGGGGQNRAWLDGVRYTPGVGVPPVLSLTQPRVRRRDGLLAAVLHSPAGIYEAQLSEDAVTWEPWTAATNLTGQVELRWSPPPGGRPLFLRVIQP